MASIWNISSTRKLRRSPTSRIDPCCFFVCVVYVKYASIRCNLQRNLYENHIFILIHKQDNIKLCRRCMFILIYLPAMSILRASLLVPQCSSALSHLQLLQEFLCLNDYKNIPLILIKSKFLKHPFTSIMCHLLSLPGSSGCTRCIRRAIG